MTKPEIRRITRPITRVAWPFVIRNSIVLRYSDFVIYLAPHLRLSELLEQQFLQRRVGRGHEKVNAARRAILAEPLAKILHGLFVGVEAIFAEGDFLLCAGLGINQAQVAVSRRVQFLRREDLDSVDLKAAPNQRRQSGLITRRIEKITQHDCHAGLTDLQRAAAQRLIQLRGPASRKLIDVLEKLKRGLAPPHRPQRPPRRQFLGTRLELRFAHRLLQHVRKSRHAHAVEAAQSDVADRGGHLPREIELARFPERHRLAGVEENRDRQFAFLFVELEKEPVEPAVEVPIEITKIVARDVTSVIGELDRLPARLAAPLALERTFRAPPREQLELLKTTEKIGGEKRHALNSSSSVWWNIFTQWTVGWATLCSPHPNPLPWGEGDFVPGLSTIPLTEFAQPNTSKHTSAGCCSLSLRERVRVRGSHRSLATPCSIS